MKNKNCKCQEKYPHQKQEKASTIVKSFKILNKKYNYYLKLNLHKDGKLSFDGWPNPQLTLWVNSQVKQQK